MTITFDRVGTCTQPSTVLVEGYSPKGGLAHGSLDVTVRVCDVCHEMTRQQLWDCGMMPYSINTPTGVGCGERTVFAVNKYTTVHEGDARM